MAPYLSKEIPGAGLLTGENAAGHFYPTGVVPVKPR
jgi:hypothetical protein